MKFAVAEKDRVENKQRLFIRYLEHKKIAYKAAFFDEYKNPNDKDEVYYKYNGTYWERDRKDRNWGRLPDIYSDKLSPELQEFLNQKK